jgi:hypothetical protein
VVRGTDRPEHFAGRDRHICAERFMVKRVGDARFRSGRPQARLRTDWLGNDLFRKDLFRKDLFRIDLELQ